MILSIWMQCTKGYLKKPQDDTNFHLLIIPFYFFLLHKYREGSKNPDYIETLDYESRPIYTIHVSIYGRKINV